MIDRKYLITQQGKQYVLYTGLLDLAHRLSEGRLCITSTVIQFPAPANDQTTVVLATAAMLDTAGRVVRSCTGIGDANPTNVGRMVAVHAVRMAETRAKARALRDLTNVAEAIDESDEVVAPEIANNRQKSPTMANNSAAVAPETLPVAHTPATQSPATQSPAKEPVDELEMLRRRYARLVLKAKAKGIDAPPLAPDAQADDITKAGKEVQELLERMARVAAGANGAPGAP